MGPERLKKGLNPVKKLGEKKRGVLGNLPTQKKRGRAKISLFQKFCLNPWEGKLSPFFGES